MSSRARAPASLGVALLLGTLLHLRQVAYLADAGNRYALHWQRADAWALIVTLLGSAALVLAVDAGLARLPQPALRRLRTPFLVWVAASGGLALLTWLEPPDWVETLGWVAALGLAAASYAVGAERSHRRLQRLGWVLLPVPLVTLGQILWWSPWGSALDSLEPPAARRADATPVYVVVFDGWSAEQSLANGSFREWLPNLRALAQTSIVFEAALAPDWETASSIPALLFGRPGAAGGARGGGAEQGEGAAAAAAAAGAAKQGEPGRRARDWKLVARDAAVEWRRGEERAPLAETSLFTPFARAGYHTALLGYYLPYRRLVGAGVEVVRAEPHVPRGWSFGERLWVRALAGARFLVAPAVTRWLRGAWPERYSENWYALNRRIEADALQVLGRWPLDTFLFAHWPTPHPPFVLNADGSYRGPFRQHRQAGSRADYRRHLANLDRIVGELVAALMARGSFERSLLVLTSDHGWKGRDERVQHVPLLLKWPGQDRPVRFHGPFRTPDLAGVLAAVAGGELDPEWLRRYLLERSRAVPRPAPPPAG